ncbi:unnamed protein product [Gongylonema pulchrum]|uniref:Ovule protein n=1 Tax=Gongylonema pulchrum TaxID=637853 RepID=A0A183DL07_9BILA|nr:unnamed protein product [Gongylonema pulchrum]
MLPAYMGEMKNDGSTSHLYFPYPPTMTPNVMAPNFPSYTVPIPPPTYEVAASGLNPIKQDQNFPSAISGPSPSSSSTPCVSSTTQHQRRSANIPIDEEARKK